MIKTRLELENLGSGWEVSLQQYSENTFLGTYAIWSSKKQPTINLSKSLAPNLLYVDINDEIHFWVDEYKNASGKIITVKDFGEEE